MKKTLTLITLSLFAISILAQDWSYRNGFATTYTLKDFGLKGKVKSFTETYSHLDDKGNKAEGNNRWHRKYKEHFNFNEHGQLVSQYNENENGDTNLIKLNTYNDKQQIINSKMYKPHYNKKCVPSYLGNWELDERNYTYKNDLLVEVTYKGESFEYTSPSRMTLEYDKKGRLISTEGKSTGEFKDTLFNQTYVYDGDTETIKEIHFSNTIERRDDGTLFYNYDKNGVLINKKFTPYNVKEAIEWGSEESFDDYDLRGNLLRYVLGDSTKWNVYIYNMYEYNEHDNVLRYEKILDYDGIGHNVSTYTYEYDKNNNWVSKTEIFDQIKRYGYGEKGTPKETYLNNRTYQYFD